MEWFKDNGREFFWRTKELSPFQMLVLEVLLKRTRAETVDKYGEDFVETYSSPERVLSAGKTELEDGIEKLGYQSRIEDLISISKEIRAEDGLKPDREFLLEIEGLGQYTVDAILCYGYGEPRVPLDVNVARVGEIYLGVDIPSDLRYADELKEKMEKCIDAENPSEFNWALQDLGAALQTEDDPLGLK